MSHKSYLFAGEPDWYEHLRGRQHDLPENIQSWIYEPGSLTQRLRDYYGNQVQVKVLLQNWNKPFLSESRHLGLPLYRYALIREVLLHSAGKPLLLARTAIPQQTITVAHRNLVHLGNRPLGEVIFSYPDLARISMDTTLVQPGSWTPIALATAKISKPAWGRRTVYEIHQRPMIITEIFLDEIVGH